MIGSALIALGLLLFRIPGGFHQIVKVTRAFGISDFFTTGLDPAKHGWSKWKGCSRRVHDFCRLDWLNL